MLRCRRSVSFSSYGTSRKPIYQKGDKEDKQEASVSRATAKEISMDATVAAVMAKLDSWGFFFLSTSKILTELPGARRVASTLATLADTDWSILT